MTREWDVPMAVTVKINVLRYATQKFKDIWEENAPVVIGADLSASCLEAAGFSETSRRKF